jgi:hypothetical protein
MPIVVKKMDDLYHVSAYGPSSFAAEPWKSPSPMTAREIIVHLTDRNWHLHDVIDAICEADPDFDRPYRDEVKRLIRKYKQERKFT